MTTPERATGRYVPTSSGAETDDDLTARCLDGRATADDLRRLEARLAADAAFRWSWVDLATIDALLAQHVFTQPAAIEAPVVSPFGESAHGCVDAGLTPQDGRSPSRWLSFIAGGLGILLGVLFTSAVWAMVSPPGRAPVRLFTEGFESGRSPLVDGVPVRADLWGGDYCEVVGERGDVTPVAGSRMLRFLRGDFEGKPVAEGFLCGTHRLVDLRPYRRYIDTGNAVVQIRARFNREAEAGEERDQCAVSVAALDGATATDGSIRVAGEVQKRSLAYAFCKHIDLDRDPSTWQIGVTELRVPERADFLLVFFGVNQFPPRYGAGVAVFSGHYCDDVRVSLFERSMVP